MWRVTHQVHLPTIALGVLWIVHSLATTLYVPWQNGRQRMALETRLAAIESALRIQESLSELQSGPQASTTPNRERELRAAVAADMDRLQRESDDVPTKKLLAQLVQDTQAWQDHSRSATARPALSVLIQDCQALIRRQEQLLLDVVDQRSRTDVVVMVVRAVLLLLGLMVGIGLAMWMTRGLKQSLSQISVTLRSAEGDLRADLGRIDVVSHAPPGELSSLEAQVRNVVLNIRRVADELQQTRQEMVRAERLAAVGEVAAGVAHEIRNPLTSVKLLVQRAAERRPVHSLNEEQLQVLLEEVSRIENTVQGLLDFARPDKPQRVQCQLSTIVARTLTLLEGRLHQQHVELVQTTDGHALAVDADPQLIQQVLVNILINAVDTMPDGGRVWLRQSRNDADGTAVVEVEDSGPGIAPAVMGRLFEPFVTTRANGSGLGLAISRRLIAEHGGSLTAANSPAGGAVFTIQLPLAVSPPPVGLTPHQARDETQS